MLSLIKRSLKLLKFTIDVSLMVFIFTVFQMIKEDSTPFKDYTYINHYKLTIINTEGFSEAEKLLFENQIISYADEYVREANARGIFMLNPIYRYKFSMKEVDLEKNKFIGHCNKDDNIIFLKPGFHIATFIHELGHCDFGYSHVSDNKFLIKNYSAKIMHWRFKNELYYQHKKEILDHFFDEAKHHDLYSHSGDFFHSLMEIEIFIRDAYNYLKKESDPISKKIAKREP